MNRCLKDKTLLLLQGKEGNSAQRAHLTQCAACAARYEDLRRDLMAISQVLREKPPAQAMAHRFRPRIIRWAPATLGMALALMLSWQGMRMWISSAPRPTGNGGRGSLESSQWIFVKFILTQRSDGGGADRCDGCRLRLGGCGSGGRPTVRMVRPAVAGENGIRN